MTISTEHPECVADEYYIGNFNLADYVKLLFKTKRLGRVCLYSNGKPYLPEDYVGGIQSVFVKKEEVDKNTSTKYWYLI